MTWLKGLVAAFVSGAASAVTASIVDPVAFPLTDLRKVGTLAIVSGVVGVALYLKQSPVPTDEDLARFRSKFWMVVLPPLILAASLAWAGCATGGRFAPGTTPQQALAYEMRERSCRCGRRRRRSCAPSMMAARRCRRSIRC